MLLSLNNTIMTNSVDLVSFYYLPLFSYGDTY